MTVARLLDLFARNCAEQDKADLEGNMAEAEGAAIHTLAVAPAEARKQLELIAEMNWFPQTADALGVLRAIDRGEYTPA